MVIPGNKNSRSRKRNFNQKITALRTPQLKSWQSRFQKQSVVHNSITSRSFKEKFKIYTGEQLNWRQVILRLAASVMPGILPPVFLCAGYGFLISLAHNFGHLSLIKDSKVLPNVIISLNIVLSLLLVFRTNTAHERFWEGRKLWGSMVNTVRNMARGIWLVIEEREPHDRADKEAILRLTAAFPVAMKLHLRREPVNSELALLMSLMEYNKLQDVNHPPLEIAFWIGDYLQHQYDRQRVNVFQLTPLHELLDDMVDILGGCERILKTPMPLLYTIILKTLLTIYFIVLPLEIVNGMTWWTAPIMAFISCILLGIDEVGSEIEEPFGHDQNDLPLDFICNTILRNVEDLITLAPSQRHFCDWPRKAA